MEDSVTENEKLQVFINSVNEDDKEVAGKEVKVNDEDVVEEKPAVGFINQIISNFTPAGDGKQQEKYDMGDKQEKKERDDDVGEKPVGLINQIICSFGPEDKEQEREEIDNEVSVKIEGKQEETETRGGGGLFSHIMSNLVSSPVSSPRARDEKQAQKAGDDLLDDAKAPEKEGKGIIDNIVSNLPTPLPDDAAPASDEASILIHSIIHD